LFEKVTKEEVHTMKTEMAPGKNHQQPILGAVDI